MVAAALLSACAVARPSADPADAETNRRCAREESFTPARLERIAPELVVTGDDASRELAAARFGGEGTKLPRGAAVTFTLPRTFERAVFAWHAHWPTPGTDAAELAPTSYFLEAAGDDGAFHPVVSVRDERFGARSHALSQVRRVRMRVDSVRGDAAVLDAVEIYDASRGASGAWLFLGDSITAGAMGGHRDRGPSVRELVAARDGRWPLVLVLAKGGENTRGALERLPAALAENVVVTDVALAYGSNDSWGDDVLADAPRFEGRMGALLAMGARAGKRVHVPTIPFAAAEHPHLGAFVAASERARARAFAERGPDLHAHFATHPGELGPDGVHPTLEGYRSVSRLWAERMR